MWICEIVALGKRDFPTSGFLRLVLVYRHFPLRGSSSRTAVCLILENGTDELSRNVGKQLTNTLRNIPEE